MGVLKMAENDVPIDELTAAQVAEGVTALAASTGRDIKQLGLDITAANNAAATADSKAVNAANAAATADTKAVNAANDAATANSAVAALELRVVELETKVSSLEAENINIKNRLTALEA